MPNKSSTLLPRASPPASTRPVARSSPKPHPKCGIESQNGRRGGSPSLRSDPGPGRSRGAPTPPPRPSPLPHGPSATERRRHYASSPAAQRAVTPTSAYGPAVANAADSPPEEPGAAGQRKHPRSTSSLSKRTLRRSATSAPQADPRAPPSKQERRDHIRPIRAAPTPSEEVLVDADGTVAYSTFPGEPDPNPEKIWVPPEHCHCCMQRAIARQKRGRSEAPQARSITSLATPTRCGTPTPEASASWRLPASRSFSTTHTYAPANRQREEAGHAFLRNLFESYRKSSSAVGAERGAHLDPGLMRSGGTRASESPTDPGRRKPSPIREQQPHSALPPPPHSKDPHRSPPARSRYGEAFHQRSLREPHPRNTA